MRYHDNREINEIMHRHNGERENVDSLELMCFLGSDNYLNKVEEMLLDILNNQYFVSDSQKDIKEHIKQELGVENE